MAGLGAVAATQDPPNEVRVSTAEGAGAPSLGPSADGMQTIGFFGDPQHHIPTDVMGVYRSLLIGTKAPGHRLPGQNLGVSLTTEALVRQVMPTVSSKQPRLVFTGDAMDVNNRHEWQAFWDVMERLENFQAANGLLLYTTSNHDHFYSGTTNDGHNGLGLVGLGLNLQGEQRSHVKNIHGYEVGGVENIMTKDVVLKELHHRLFGQNTDDGRNTTIIQDTDREAYQLANGDRGEWIEAKEVYQRFWRETPDGRWNALVHYKDRDPKHPVAEWLYVSAAKLGDAQAGDESYPIYAISIDTMDFFDEPSLLETILGGASSLMGGLLGHVSPAQVALIKSFIASKKIKNPNSRFVLVGHYPIEELVEFTDSKMNTVFSDDSVVAYVAAHKHARGFQDLAAGDVAREYDIVRRNPLPQIIVPAVIDHPNEMLTLSFGSKPSKPAELRFDFQFKGIEEDAIPSNTERVCTELNRSRPHLTTYATILQRIADPRIRELGSPHTSLVKGLNLMLDPDEGLFTDPGKLHDLIVDEDVIPGMVTDAPLLMRLFIAKTKLLLLEGGLAEEAENFERVYSKALHAINEYYERIRAGEYTDISVSHPELHELDLSRGQVDTVTQRAVSACTSDKLVSESTAEQRDILTRAEHSMTALKVFLHEYQSWMKHYEVTQRVGSNPSELINDADLFSRPSFKLLFRHMSQVPYGSEAAAYLTHVQLESAEQYKVFYRGAASLTQQVPDRMTLAVDTETGKRTLSHSDLEAERSAQLRRGAWCEMPGGYRDYASEARDRVREDPGVPNEREFEEHWVLRTSPFVGFGDGSTWGGSLATGVKLHLWRNWESWYGFNATLLAEGVLGWEGRDVMTAAGEDVFGFKQNGELNLRASVTVSAFGVVELGPSVMIGMGRRGLGDANPTDERHKGIGVVLPVYDGTMILGVHRIWYSGDTKAVRLQLNLDFLALARYYNNVLPRHY